MTHPENEEPLWNESRLENLLEDFFRKEMPAALRTDSPELPLVSAREFSPAASVQRNQFPNGRAQSKSGFLPVGIASLMLVMVGLLFWPGSSSEPDTVSQSKPLDRATTTVVENTERNSGTSEAERAFDHNGEGPVELRSTVPFVGVKDPMETTDPDFPELDIEVFPVEKQPAEAEKPNANEHRLPESQPRQTPMPEEHRTLPEGQPPRQTDPDEAARQPILPELRGVRPVPMAI